MIDCQEALRHIEHGEYALAEACYASALTEAPERAPMILGLMATVCAKQGKTRMAIALLEKRYDLVDDVTKDVVRQEIQNLTS